MSVKGNKYIEHLVGVVLTKRHCSGYDYKIEICINEDINSIEDYARSYSEDSRDPMDNWERF